MTWEPSVVPAITPNQSAATAEKPLADFNTTVQDLWLQLLQAATYAARAVHALSKPVAALTGAVVPPAPLEAQQSLQSDVSTVVGTPQAQAPLATMPSVGSTAVTQTPTAAGAAVQAVLNPMGQAADNFMRELVTLSKHVSTHTKTHTHTQIHTQTYRTRHTSPCTWRTCKWPPQ